jgi:hypothetical protein
MSGRDGVSGRAWPAIGRGAAAVMGRAWSAVSRELSA